MGGADSRVRTARPQDAPAIARVHVESWKATYAALLPADAIASRTVEVRTRQWAESLESGVPRRILVAERDGRVVGFGAAGPARDAGAEAELYSLYLAPDALGEGFGHALWEALRDPLAGDGFREVVLWVAEDNARARRFYAREGFRPDGGHQSECSDGAPLAAVRYRAALPPLPFARSLAKALDIEDFEGAALRLDPDVAYETGEETLRGIEAVVGSYRDAAARARAMLDDLANESEVEAVDAERFRVRYSDRLRHCGEAHVYRCEQILTLPPGRGVTRIEHRELPGERARLLEFFDRVGIR